MPEKSNRKPIKNFLIKRPLQTKIIFQILVFMLLTTFITTLMLVIAYNMKSQAGHFYYMSNDVMKDLELVNVLIFILPSLITAQLVSLLIAFIIGLFSSRKAAVPIYKIEKWAEELRGGNLKTRLGFREQEEMKELTTKCNDVADYYRGIFGAIHSSIEQIESGMDDREKIVDSVTKIKATMNKIDFK
jgi:methyl-accepting chemotaxis protein